MKSLNQKVVILTVLILANVSFAGTYSGGNGSDFQPYQIGNPGDWQELMTTSDDWNSSFYPDGGCQSGGDNPDASWKQRYTILWCL